MDDSPHDPAASPEVPTTGRYVAAGAAVLAVSMVGAAGIITFRVLDAIENAPEDYKTYGERITLLALGAAVCVTAAGAFGWQHPPAMFGRAFRFAAVAGLIALVCSGCPVPGGLVAGTVLLIAAARLGVAALTPVACLVRPGLAVPSYGLILAAAFTAFVAVSGALLALKRDGLGWAFGVD